MSSPSEISLADEAASEWAARVGTAPLTPDEERKLAAWLAEDSGNEARLERYLNVFAQVSEAVPRLVDAGTLSREVLPVAPVIRPPRAVFLRWATGLAAAAALALAAFWWSARPETLATHAAQRQSLTLADGSKVELNAQTEIEVRLGRAGRNVHLEQGEAFFDVAKNPDRPFFVETPAGTVRVLGTAFNVRSAGEGQIEVTVLNGSVAVAPGATAVPTSNGFILCARDQLTFDGAKSAVHHLSAGATADALAWREGWVAFQNEPLGSAVQRFARYHGLEIEISSDVANLELGGRFQLDPLEEFLHDITQALPVKVLHTSDGRIVVTRR